MSEINKPLKVYISGPIEGMELIKAIKNFDDAEAKLKKMGFKDIVNPLKISTTIENDALKYQKSYFNALLDCDTICMIQGCEDSTTAKLEFYLATQLNYTVIHL